ncbi:septal ring lytic transglycosylase RlpA family protein [Streptomyces peucetius]|uniref:Septal ring lytic transglycosylase RlpA family protein n=1 Tax=Streptomyces peucetius TaxID=1950 RepID=A0ABY6I427_STRPE|nr:septal ring lytic transglycosylase RlpA family protein [Streptomyces peucetius]UYQ61738.1 septal ring lytic transglycosylase RlpA family protein [Streptomyces peucetius]
MSRKKTLSGKKKLALLVGAAAMAGGTAIVMTGTSNASVACDGLAQAIRNNENFIAGQRATPDAQSAARIANREAVIAQIGVQQEAAGCATGDGGGGGGDEAAAPPAAEQPPTAEEPPGDEQGGGNGGEEAGGNAGGAAGEVVCAGSTVTLSGEGGAPAASSSEFPVGTRLRVTNLDNDRSTTVEVTSVSGSCALLNNAAFEQVREAGKFLIRNARIERVG